MANKTMIKFGHPNTVIGQTEHWTVQLRPEQVTLGSFGADLVMNQSRLSAIYLTKVLPG